MLLGNMPHEYDFVFSGTADEFISCNPNARKAGTVFEIAIENGIEYAPMRGKNIEEDLLSRDITINAVALDTDGRLYSHPLSFTDINNKVLRFVSDSSLEDDPVRAFRIARFAAAYPDFSVHPASLSLLQSLSTTSVLQELIPERIGLELCKALQTAVPGRFVEVLEAARCLAPWFSELVGFSERPAGPVEFHSENCLEHTVAVMNGCAGNPLAVYMALCHDLGKLCTPLAELPRHLGHEKAGVAPALALGQRLRLPQRMITAGAIAAREHMKGGQYLSLKCGTRVDLLMKLYKADVLEAFFVMVAADSGKQYLSVARKELAKTLAVRLPEEYQNMGKESGKKLRELRCHALTH